MAHSPTLLERYGIDHVDAIGQRLVHRTALCHLPESLSLRVNRLSRKAAREYRRDLSVLLSLGM